MNKDKIKKNHLYYNKQKDTWLLVENWGNKEDGFSLCVETFIRKEEPEFKPEFQGKGIIAYEATDELPTLESIDDSDLLGFVDRGLLGNAAYLTRRYGGSGNTEVDLVVPRYNEVLKALKKKVSIKTFAKLAYKYDDVIYSPKGLQRCSF